MATIKMTWGGSLASNEEIWSCGINLADANDTLNADQYWTFIKLNIGQLASATSDFHSRAATRIPSGARLEWVKVARIGNDGRYMDQPAEHIYPTAVNGGSSNAQYVPQVSTVVTLISSKYKDPGKYNRFYLPTRTPTTSNSFSLTTAEAEGIAESAVTWLEAINADIVYESPIGSITTRISPSIYSKTLQTDFSVVKASVGTIFDTQRRRRNKLQETYMEVPADINY